MKRVNILDASWLAVESEDTPMHVGNLQIYALPDNAPHTFLRDMVARMKTESDIVPPWNLQLVNGGKLGRTLAPTWNMARDIDLDYHVRHSALPAPGGERELGILISRLHSNPLDFSRPLWECHVIEGLENNRFAMYTKMHHSLIDGISGVKLMSRILSQDPNERNMLSPWSVGPKRRPLGISAGDEVPSVQGALAQIVNNLKKQATNVPKLVTALGRLVYSGIAQKGDLKAPFVGPRSPINNRVTPQRRFATQQYDLARIKSISHACGASLNDIVLYLCGSAIRRFLLENDTLPEQALTAGIPVNIRPADDDGTGTAISFMIASLATDLADPDERLQAIMESTRIAKNHLQQLPRESLNQYTMLLMSPYILQLLTGLGGRMRPAFNITISNVPGPATQYYYEGAALEAMYPVSLIAHGGALNITCLSYNGSLNFGYTGCRDTLPHMQRLAVYTGEALDELEARLGLVSATTTSAPAKAAGSARVSTENGSGKPVARKSKAAAGTAQSTSKSVKSSAARNPAASDKRGGKTSGSRNASSTRTKAVSPDSGTAKSASQNAESSGKA